jgi:hypothetical protein
MPSKAASLANQQKVETTITFAPQGLTKTALMGELGHLLALPVYQLALPFTHEAWRQLEYSRVLTGTGEDNDPCKNGPCAGSCHG